MSPLQLPLSDWSMCFVVSTYCLCWDSPVPRSIGYLNVSFLPHTQALTPCESWGSCCFVLTAYIWGFIRIPSNFGFDFVMCLLCLLSCRDWSKFKKWFYHHSHLPKSSRTLESFSNYRLLVCMEDTQGPASLPTCSTISVWQWQLLVYSGKTGLYSFTTEFTST